MIATLTTLALASASIAPSGWSTAGPQDPTLGTGDVEALYVAGDEAASVAFLCDDDTIQARIATAPTDLSGALKPTFGRARRASGWIEIDGERAYEGGFVYLPDEKIALPNERSAAAKLYNAAIQGQAVRVRVKGEATPLTLPPVDEAFADFHARCQSRGAM